MSRVDRYQRPEVFEALAAAYVLGTLKGGARRRFLRLLGERAYLAAAVEAWQQRLAPLAETAPQMTPPPRVWRSIERELAAQRRVQVRARTGWWDSLALWRLATAFSLALLVLTLLPTPPTEPPMPQYVAVLEAPGKGPMMVATGTGRPWTLTVALMVDMDMPDTEQMRLWCYPKGGGKPIPMGRVTTDKYTVFTLSQHDWDGLGEMGELAINVEPMGSDAPEPMGPMRYMGRLERLAKT